MDQSFGDVTPVGGWEDEEQVAWYLARIGRLEARKTGEQVLVEALPAMPHSALDLGCGDGVLLGLALQHRPSLRRCVAVDRSAPMLERARARFAGRQHVEVRQWDLNNSITPLGTFDAVVSGFAIHHLSDDRKRELFREVYALLNPGGVFANLDVVASDTPALHAAFLAAIGRTADDPEDRLASVEDQCAWLRGAGFDGVGCLWRWRGFAVFAAERNEVDRRVR